MDRVVCTFAQVRENLKIFHWQTCSYSKHVASDQLLDKLNVNMDKFVEVFQGAYNRVEFTENINIVLKNETNTSIVDTLNAFKLFLYQIHTHIDIKNDLDLLNIRDEMIADINQTLFLFNLS
jgi:hypothetical protein